MVLRSGIIIPFQFRDTKKLLMIGVPEENRNLNIWDLKNVGKLLLMERGRCSGAGAMEAACLPLSRRPRAGR